MTYEPMPLDKAMTALDFAMNDLQEQIEEDEHLMQGRYLFRICKCEQAYGGAAGRGANLEQGSQKVSKTAQKARSSFNNQHN